MCPRFFILVTELMGLCFAIDPDLIPTLVEVDSLEVARLVNSSDRCLAEDGCLVEKIKNLLKVCSSSNLTSQHKHSSHPSKQHEKMKALNRPSKSKRMLLAMKNKHSSRCFTVLRLLNSVAEQRSRPDASRGEVEEGYILVRFELYTEIASLRPSGFPMMWKEETLVDEEEFLFHLPSLKKLESYRSKCSGIILESLSLMGVPMEECPSAIEKMFKAVDVAVSTELPIDVSIRDRTYHIGRTIGGLKKFEAEAADTSSSSSSCSICLEDFPATLPVNQPITRLPCGHRYHTYCAIRWLKVNPRCPVCRYSMPFINCACIVSMIQAYCRW